VIENQFPVNYAQRGLSLDSEGLNRNVNVAIPTLAQRQASDPLMPGGANRPDAQDGEDLLPGQTDVAAPDGPDDERNTGYLWDNALRAGLTVRDYGFFIDTNCYSEPSCQTPLIHMPFQTNTIVAPSTNVALTPYTDPYFRGFDPAFPDYYRFKEWERDFDTNYAAGGLPNLTLVRFMHDHTGNFAVAIDGVNTRIAMGLEDLPDRIRVVVVSRTGTPASLARLRASRKLAMIDYEDLRYTLGEASELVRKTVPGVADEALRQIHEAAQGWAAGIILMLERSSLHRAGAETAASSTSTNWSASAQNVTLSAAVSSNYGTVNDGTVTFTVLYESKPVGSAVTSGTVTSGAASASYLLLGATAPDVYTIQAVYKPGPDFYSSSDTSPTLTVNPEIAVTLGTVDLNSSSTATAVFLTFSAGGALGTTTPYRILTQGITSLDFTDAGGGTCTNGQAYGVGDSCTVKVVFAPQAAGWCYGAVVALDANGNVLTTTYLQGYGSGAQMVFSPGSQVTQGGGSMAPLPPEMPEM
jgi:hypothetical protein